MSILGAHTTASEAAAVFAEQIKGKTVLITGPAPDNVAAEYCKAIAPYNPYLIVLAGRSRSDIEAIQSELKKEFPNVQTRLLVFDLSSQNQVRQAADEIEKYSEKIDVIVNNAGVMACPYGESDDGIEMHFATNHLGHFLLTNLLIKSKKLGSGSRVVNVTSGAHFFGAVRFDDISFNKGKSYVMTEAYGQSKTANILYSLSLAEKLRKQGILAYSVSLGPMKTRAYRYFTDAMLQSYGLKNAAGEWTDSDHAPWSTVPEGAANHVVGSFDPSIVEQNGSYIEHCHPNMEKCNAYAKDMDNAAKLWKLSEDLVHEKFDF